MNTSSNSAARAKGAGISQVLSSLFPHSSRIRLPRSAVLGLSGAIVLGMLLAAPQLVRAQVCAVPGSDRSSSVSGVVNTYYSGNGSLSAGATSLTLGARDARGSATPIAVGDLVLVMQMQDGTLNSSNNSNYGAGNGTGQGTTSMGNAGRYEFVRADSVSGGSVTFYRRDGQQTLVVLAMSSERSLDRVERSRQWRKQASAQRRQPGAPLFAHEQSRPKPLLQ